jgi:NADPH:quinone reductase-like Zn-dependent oxidoreductase
VPTNSAAWLPGNGRLLEVGPAAFPTAGPNELVVRNRALAVNPVDWIVQTIGSVAYRWLQHPAVLGTDVAGEVVEVGQGVTRFAVGDRVLGLAVGTEKDRDRPAEGAFQEYTVLSEALAAPIPDGMDDVHAVVLPLTVSTAATGLFEQDQLGLRLPSAGGTGGAVLVWGAGTAVGANAVQLARAAGYEVVATASTTTADLVRGLGAAEVIDRRAPDVIERVVAALRGRGFAGAIACATGSAAPSIEVAARLDGVKTVASVSTAASFAGVAAGPGVLVRALPTFLRMAAGETAVRVRARRSGVRLTTVWGSDLRHSAVGPAIWRDLLPAALADGSFRPVPEPLVVGHGLGALQEALDVQRRGVSARKVVVTL